MNFAVDYGAGDGNRSHVRSLGSLAENQKNVRIGGIFAFFGFLKWIPIGAAGRTVTGLIPPLGVMGGTRAGQRKRERDPSQERRSGWRSSTRCEEIPRRNKNR